MKKTFVYLAIFSLCIIPYYNNTFAASPHQEWLSTMKTIIDWETPEPTTASRFYATIFTAMYDAWSTFEKNSDAVYILDIWENTGGENTLENKEEILNFTAYHMLSYFVPKRKKMFLKKLTSLGYDYKSTSKQATLARKIAKQIFTQRYFDGSNQKNSYDDTTNYEESRKKSLSNWNPLLFINEPQMAITPHWANVKAFALTSSDEFRPKAPMDINSKGFSREVDYILNISSKLTDEQKASAEYWAPFFSVPSTQLLSFTADISLRDKLTLDQETQLFFIVSNAIFDAGIAAWDSKYYYDYVRPITIIQAKGNTKVTVWDSKTYKTSIIQAKDWFPYLSTPAFPEYVSGHSTFTSAWAEVMTNIPYIKEFNHSYKISRLAVERRYLEKPVILKHPTYKSATKSSGLSRIYGGVHWTFGNDEGLKLGEKVGKKVYEKAYSYINGQNVITPSPIVIVKQKKIENQSSIKNNKDSKKNNKDIIGIIKYIFMYLYSR